MRKAFLYCMFSLICLAYCSGQKSEIDSIRLLLRTASHDTLKAAYLNSIGIRYRSSQLDSAAYYLEAAIGLAEEHRFEKGRANAHFNVAAVYYMLGDYEKAIASYDVAKAYFINRNPKLYATANMFVTQVNVKLGKIDQAIEDNLTAIAFARKTKDTFMLSIAYNSLGVVYSAEGNTVKAIENFYLSAQLKEQIGDFKNATVSFANIGDMHRSNRDYESARIFLNKAQRLANDYDYAVILPTLNQYFGVLCLEEGDTTRAIGHFREGLRLAGKKNADVSSSVHTQLGEILNAQDSTTSALRHLDTALQIVRTSGKQLLLPKIYNALGNAHAAEKSFALAAEYYEKALNSGLGTDNPRMKASIYENLSGLYADVGSPDKAFSYLRSANELYDTIFAKEKLEAIVDIQSRYQLQEKETRIARQNLIIEQNTNRQRTLLFGLIASLLIGLLAFLWLRFRSLRQSVNSKIQLNAEKLETEKLGELNRLKSRFLTNISHEFRTPLTMISAPVEQMIAGTLTGDYRHYLKGIKRNADRLLQLVDQLLVLARMESGKLPLRVSRQDVSAYLLELLANYVPFAKLHHKLLSVEPDGKVIHGYIDSEVLRKILNNLVINAIIHSGDGEEIMISFQQEEDLLNISIADDGPGIPEKDLPELFDRFYRSEFTSAKGSGVGLSLTKELTELHKGHISAFNQANGGAVFSLSIPLKADAYLPTEVVANTPKTTSPDQNIKLLAAYLPDEEMPSLLLVEDNDELRSYMEEQLSNGYRISTALNGLEGLSKAAELKPDLIITDVMMPEMDGIEMVGSIRNDLAISHTPVIMLTAKSEREDLMQGLTTGVDAYLTKPFDIRELHLRIENLLSLRQRLHDHFRQNALYVPETAGIPTPTSEFITKVQQHVQEHMADDTFSVIRLSELLAMSRSTLTRKLRVLTGMGPNELIRNIRLEMARKLLSRNQAVSEVAYAVGFNHLSYFSKCYKEKFGVSPSKDVM